MSDDDLRDQLTKAFMGPAQTVSRTTALIMAERAMPVVRAALAQAWDDGETAGMGQMNGADTSNPWREDN